MTSKTVCAIIFAASFAVSGCRQADGPMPQPTPEIQGELEDIRHDLQNAAKGDPAGVQDLTDDVAKYSRRATAIPAVNELTRRTVSAISGKNINEQAGDRLAHGLWTTVAARELSERQIETLQNDVQSILVSIGIAEQQAQQVAAQVGEVQKAVGDRPRRWYELF
jgi:hypothetical protein